MVSYAVEFSTLLRGPHIKETSIFPLFFFNFRGVKTNWLKLLCVKGYNSLPGERITMLPRLFAPSLYGIGHEITLLTLNDLKWRHNIWLDSLLILGIKEVSNINSTCSDNQMLFFSLTC